MVGALVAHCQEVLSSTEVQGVLLVRCCHFLRCFFNKAYVSLRVIEMFMKADMDKQQIIYLFIEEQYFQYYDYLF